MQRRTPSDRARRATSRDEVDALLQPIVDDWREFAILDPQVLDAAERRDRERFDVGDDSTRPRREMSGVNPRGLRSPRAGRAFATPARWAARTPRGSHGPPTAVHRGVNGFVGTDVEMLLTRMATLLGAPDLATLLGAPSRVIAHTRFATERFRADSHRVLSEFAQHTTLRTRPVGTTTE